jgi:hypothetical protein
MMTLLTAGIAIGSAATSVVWASHQFPDVPNSSPFHADIDWAVDHAIVNGYADGKFHPADPVSRQAATAMLHRYNGQFQIVFAPSLPYSGATEVNGSATCPAGSRALAGAGNTSSFNMFLTDIIVIGDHVNVRWETDDNATASGNANVWVLCGPTN